MLRNCPNHDIPRHIHVHTFYHGLTDGAAPLKAASVIDADQVTSLNAKIDFVMQSMKNFGVNQVQHTSVTCEECGESISLINAPTVLNPFSLELQEVVKKPTKLKGKEVISKENEKEVEAPLEVSKPTTLQPPFPQRLQKQKLEKQFQKFLKIFKKLHINIPFAEALKQMPSYVKFMKDILSKKIRLGDYETVALTEEYSAIIQNKLPPKLKDPGSFTIPCTIGTHFSGRALCDLGASINLMTYSIYRILGLGEAKPTSITLQIADRSLTYPKGVIEDILVKVDKFIFPADFVVFDMEVDSEIPIILGRPFLATGRTLIDVQNGELTMRVQDQQRKDSIAERPLDPLGRALLDLIDEENKEDFEAVKTLDASKLFKSRGVESLERTTPFKVLKPSIEEPPSLELKPLPNHLCYAYLGEFDILPVEKLLRVLRNHKSAIGWTIANIKGISASFCMHKILLEDDQKPSVESQRRLNPIMKEVVKKEIIKWLDARIIYPISNSSCLIDYSREEILLFCRWILGINQIVIVPKDQKKTTFTCPYDIFAFRRMPFRLCNAPATFQRCMMAIFTDMVENFLEVFMDDFSVYGNSFDECLNNLSSVLKRCEDTNLVLNWKKCHFMVQEEIVLGHSFQQGY
ncbi:DNA-directed DNA polymerase [Handroanthus impetiginosus]|uniref:DNA-directed DNA polymerase n=1 Tax=Handroanthus impetiginosus TaxID=429701 RepID=A0A2G9FYI0_9LAMI|nr:DNA-directed DNA polymerase [Handroanthus impetiginosus]